MHQSTWISFLDVSDHVPLLWKHALVVCVFLFHHLWRQTIYFTLLVYFIQCFFGAVLYDIIIFIGHRPDYTYIGSAFGIHSLWTCNAPAVHLRNTHWWFSVLIVWVLLKSLEPSQFSVFCFYQVLNIVHFSYTCLPFYFMPWLAHCSANQYCKAVPTLILLSSYYYWLQ